MNLCFTFLVTSTLLVSPALASELDSEIENYFRVIWGLLVVLGIILVLYGILRKRFSLTATAPTKNINVLEVKPLMGKKALCLVEVKGQEYLIGLSENNISHLATLNSKPDTSFINTLNDVKKGTR